MFNKLCNHISRLFSGEVPQGIINSFVDSLSKKNSNGVFIDSCKAIGLSLERLCAGYQNPWQPLEGYFSHEKITLDDGSKEIRPSHPFFTEIEKIQSRHTYESDKMIAGLMKLHTADHSKSLSQSEKDKIRENITSQSKSTIEDEQFAQFLRYMRLFANQMKRHQEAKKVTPKREYKILNQFPSNQNKSLYSNVNKRTNTRDKLMNYNVSNLLDSKLYSTIYHSHPVETMNCLFTGGNMRVIFREEILNRYRVPSSDIDGSISVIPEPGRKKRVVACPSAVGLSLNYPLSQILHSFIKDMPTQGVKSHEDTTSYLQSKIDGKNEFYSVDSTAFTDRLPYSFQRMLLKEMRNEGVIEDFDLHVQDCICQQSFAFPDGYPGETLSYKVGTPQGTFASFPLASLANGCLALIAYHKAHPDKEINIFNDYPFRVIGDDYVSYDPPSAKEYISLLTQLGVEVSEQKSIVSRDCALMCSKLITSNGVFQQKKLKDVDTLDASIEANKYYDFRFSDEISKNYEEFRDLPFPYGFSEPDPSSPLHAIAEVKQLIKPIMPLQLRKVDLESLIERNQSLRDKVLIDYDSIQYPPEYQFPTFIKEKARILDEIVQGLPDSISAYNFNTQLDTAKKLAASLRRDLNLSLVENPPIDIPYFIGKSDSSKVSSSKEEAVRNFQRSMDLEPDF